MLRSEQVGFYPGISDAHLSTMTRREYHESTKHSVESLRRARRVLDWMNMPDPFRHYEALQSYLRFAAAIEPATARFFFSISFRSSISVNCGGRRGRSVRCSKAPNDIADPSPLCAKFGQNDGEVHSGLLMLGLGAFQHHGTRLCWSQCWYA
jgi:hypothetical protein